jgi:hypothetical protein
MQLLCAAGPKDFILHIDDAFEQKLLSLDDDETLDQVARY